MLAFFLTAQASAPQIVPAPVVEPAAMALLKKNRDAMFALKGYRAEREERVRNLAPKPGQSSILYRFAAVAAAKPGLLRYEEWPYNDSPLMARPADAPDQVIVSDGKTRWTQRGKVYSVFPAGDPLFFLPEASWEAIYGTGSLYLGVTHAMQSGKVAMDVVGKGQERIDGVLCDRVEIDRKSEFKGRTYESRVLVSIRSDGLLRRLVLTANHTVPPGPFGDANEETTYDYVRIEKDPDLRGVSFAYTPPAGVTPAQPPTYPAMPSRSRLR